MTKKPAASLHDKPLNMPAEDDLEALLALDVGVMSIHDSPLLGTLTLVTRDGHYDFLINEQIANELIQEARALLRAIARLWSNVTNSQIAIGQ